MELLEFLDRTGLHVSRKFFEKYKDGRYYLIYMKLTDKQKKQIEEDLAAYTNEYAGKPMDRCRNIKRAWAT